MATATTTTYNEAWTGAKKYLEDRLKSTKELEDADFGIPIIDIGPSFSSSLASRQEVATKIRQACLTSGFFYITNHNIPQQACSTILHEAERLFHDLPLSSKQAIHLKNSPYGYGWEDSASTSLNGDVERKEGFNWSYEDELDPSGGDGKYVQLDGTTVKDVNQWPDLPDFRDGIKEYYGPALLLARHLCRLFALSLNLEEEYFDPMITHPSGNARLMYYPAPTSTLPKKDDEEGEGIGLGAHSDYQCFTILLCSTTPGLEILSPSGKWITAPYVENGLIVNLGDMMMRWTNGLYKSTVHRVVNRSKVPRYSVPLFFGVNNDVLVETIPTCISEDNPEKYEPIKAGEYVLQRLATTRTY